MNQKISAWLVIIAVIVDLVFVFSIAMQYINAIQWLMTLLQGVIISVIGGYILLRFILPSMAAQSASATLKAAKKDPEIAKVIDQAKKFIDIMEPIITEFKTFDLNGLKKELLTLKADATPFLKAMGKVNSEDIQNVMMALKDLMGTAKKAIEKPKIPSPDKAKEVKRTED